MFFTTQLTLKKTSEHLNVEKSRPLISFIPNFILLPSGCVECGSTSTLSQVAILFQHPESLKCPCVFILLSWGFGLLTVGAY